MVIFRVGQRILSSDKKKYPDPYELTIVSINGSIISFKYHYLNNKECVLDYASTIENIRRLLGDNSWKLATASHVLTLRRVA